MNTLFLKSEQLTHDCDDDFVEHDLDDSGGDDSDDSDDDEDDEMSDEDSDVDDSEVDSDESSSKHGSKLVHGQRGNNRKPRGGGGGKKSNANTTSKKNKSRGQLISVNSCHNADNKLYESQSSNNNGTKINEDNFVTVTQKDEITCQLHNGILFFF